MMLPRPGRGMMARAAIWVLFAIALHGVSSEDGISPPIATLADVPGVPSDIPSTDDRNCRLLGPFALFIQALMGVVVVGSLVLKRQRERPMRPWKIWLLDISKQMLGQLFVHSLNVLLSWLGSRASEGEDNPCSLYFLNIAIDTTLGVLFIYYSMRFLTHYTTDVLAWPGFVSGQYYSTPAVMGRRRKKRVTLAEGDNGTGEQGNGGGSGNPDESPTLPSRPSMEREPSSWTTTSNGGMVTVRRSSDKPRLSFFFKQLALYLLSLLLMKVMVVLLFTIFPFLYDIGRWVLDLFGERKRIQIFFVMALFPLAMNTLQFWLIDSVLRHDPNTSRYKSDEEAYGVSEGGMASAQAGDDDIEQGRQGHSLDAQYDAATNGPWTSAWWTALFGGGGEHRGRDARQARGQYQQVGRHSIGEASTDGEEEREEGHTYPPSASQSSSVAKLDEQDGKQSAAEERREAAAPIETEESEEEQAWDNWSEDEDSPAIADETPTKDKRHVD